MVFLLVLLEKFCQTKKENLQNKFKQVSLYTPTSKFMAAFDSNVLNHRISNEKETHLLELKKKFLKGMKGEKKEKLDSKDHMLNSKDNINRYVK